MTPDPHGRRARLRSALGAALAAALAVGVAYQVQRPLEVRAGAGALGEWLLHDVYGGEEHYRWTRARSSIVFPEPGPGVPVRVELDVSGWRPRRAEPPTVTLTAGGARLRARPPARGETLALVTRTGGIWRSDLRVELASDTFTPSRDDPRALGVRLSAARLVPADEAWRPRRPPLRPVTLAALAAALLAVATRRPRVVAAGFALSAGLGFTFARPWAALTLPWAVIALAGGTALAWLLPRPVRALAALGAATLRALRDGARGALRPATLAGLACGTLVFVLADRARPPVELDVGSGRAAIVAEGLGAYDALGGVRFRTAGPRTRLDLGDFGSGAFDLSLRASAPGTATRADVGTAGGEPLPLDLAPEWRVTPLRLAAPWGWRPGPVVSFNAEAERLGVRLDRLRLTRSGGWPGGRVLAGAVGAAALLALALGACGFGARTAGSAAFVALGALGAGVLLEPGALLPFVPQFTAVAALGTLLAALLAGCAARAARDNGGAPAPGVRAAVVLGYIGWLTAAAFPLYRGGHFVFHSAIAEEIWNGRFLIYYLPYPGSMLSQQAQWGNVIVPHPCLYHTLAAPLAALPRAAFYAAEKALLALLLAGIALVAARLAARAGGARAAVWAALIVAAAVPGYQLLGLGHLMTLLGCCAGTLALGFVALRAERLHERATFAAAVALLIFAFLAYTASLLFSGLVLAALVAFWWRRRPGVARPLLAALLFAGLAAFLLYYVHWTWPFLSESLPRLLGGTRAPTDTADRWARLLAQPGKLDYSYGLWLVPVLGLLGLLRVRDERLRAPLLVWGALLPVFMGLDLFFNFLLKHHYFVLAPVAVGAALLLARLEAAGRPGRAAALLVGGGLVLLGLDTAAAVATGLIP